MCYSNLLATNITKFKIEQPILLSCDIGQLGEVLIEYSDNS